MSDLKGSEANPDHGDEKTALTLPNGDKEADPTIPMEGTELDSSKVKFINDGASDVHVKFPLDSSSDQAFCGLTKEELQKYANDPYWIRVRWVLLILFWLAWFAMLAAAIIIIIVAPKCPPRPNLEWWQTSAVYQACPKSFQDTNHDGVGDLKGIEKHLDYINSLNATTVWLNPIYESPMKDFGYDITNHKAIDPVFGTMADFDSLRRAMHNKGMKLVLDFVPNHTSKNHTWFQESLKSKDNEYSDYYIWRDGKNGGPPNNWLSVYGGSAWTFDATRNQYYYHKYSSEQPDLNLRNKAVLTELEAILRFWLDKRVDGFRVSAAAYLFESNNTDDEPLSKDPGFTENDYGYLKHTLTEYQPESYELITQWREILDEYIEKSERYRFMAVETYGVNTTHKFYEYNGKKGADLPLNHALVNIKQGCGGSCVAGLVDSWLNNLPSDKWSSWILGNHDKSRVTSRVGEMYTNAVNMLNLLLPGTAFTYYGEEIGMVDGKIVGSDVHDKYGRDPERTPMQWNSDYAAGFSDVKPWLPVNSDYKLHNVKFELAHGRGKTNLEVYQEMAVLRQEPSFQWGSYDNANVVSDSIYAFIRQAEGFDGFIVAINFGPMPDSGDFHAASPDKVPRKGIIVGTTGNFQDSHRADEYEVGTEVYLDNVHLLPGEGVVFRWSAADIAQLNEEVSDNH